MQEVVKIRQPIIEEMDRFEEKFKAAMASNVSLLNRITYYIASRKGKQMRPMFVFLVAKLLGEGKIEERTYRGASIIELIHTASLVHDDVVDGSERRRGFFSINALWKNKIAVLVGDYFFSKGLLLSLDHDDFDLLNEAKALLMYAFANNVLESVKIPQLKKNINKLVAKKLGVNIGFDL